MATEAFPSSSIEAQIRGEISGQVAVGNYILQVGSVHGGVVNVAVPEQQPQVRLRSGPVSLRPRPFPDLLDRSAEISAATAALQSSTAIEFHGPAGLGKTALLRHLAHQPAADALADGIVYLSARHQSAEDLQQSLFDVFYESVTPGGSVAPFVPTPVQVRHALRHKQALILLDDVELPRDQVAELMDVAQRCAFVLASPERRLWGEGQAIALHGLPVENAQALVARELGRPLTPEERPSAQALCVALKGHPLHILQAAAAVREGDRSLAEAARQVQVPSPIETLAAQALSSLPEPEKRVLAALAALNGTPLPVEHLAALTGLADAASALETLQERGLIQSHSPRYSLSGDLEPYLHQAWDLTAWTERALAHFTTWAEERRPASDSLLKEAEAILEMLEWAVGTGRWTETLRLGRAIEGALTLGGRWGAWAQVLQWMRQAAQTLGDRAAEAWASHQLGSRALCLGDAATARALLGEALHMRESLGDQVGAAVTRHNLELLVGPPAPPRRPSKPPQPSPAKAAGTSFLLKGIALLLILSLLVAVGWGTWYFWMRRIPPPRPPDRERPSVVTVEPREPGPSPDVTVQLEGDCYREYGYHDQTRLIVEANVQGLAEITLDGETIERFKVAPERPWDRVWTFEDLRPGEHQLEVTLHGDSGEVLAQGVCPFGLAPRE